jgi:hypothetical protein
MELAATPLSSGPTTTPSSCTLALPRETSSSQHLPILYPRAIAIRPCQNSASTPAPHVQGTMSIMRRIGILDLCAQLSSFMAHPVLINRCHLLPFPTFPLQSFTSLYYGIPIISSFCCHLYFKVDTLLFWRTQEHAHVFLLQHCNGC